MWTLNNVFLLLFLVNENDAFGIYGGSNWHGGSFIHLLSYALPNQIFYFIMKNLHFVTSHPDLALYLKI